MSPAYRVVTVALVLLTTMIAFEAMAVSTAMPRAAAELDAIGGYAYLMLLAYEMYGDAVFLDESRTALTKYLSFADNPWYEVPDGSLAVVAAARLSALGDNADAARALALLLDPAAALVSAPGAGVR